MKSLKQTANKIVDKHLPALQALAGNAQIDIPKDYTVSLRMPKTTPNPETVLTALLSLALPLPEDHTIESWTEHLKTTLIQAGIDVEHVDKMFKLKEV